MPLLTPQFDLTQTHTHLVITIRLPYVKPTNAEFLVEGTNFHFYLKPYSLKLHFKQPLKDTESPQQLVYDPSTFTLTVHLQKQTPGEHFEDLSIISTLMTKKRDKQKSKKLKKPPLIEVIGGGDDENTNDGEVQQLTQGMQGLSLGKHTYGFNGAYSEVFNDLEEELYELAVVNPQYTSQEQRMALLAQQVKEDFDEEHYVYDFLENEEVDEALNLQLQFETKYDADDIKVLSSLPQKDYLISNSSRQEILNQIVDILYAMLYELRVMQGEYNPESAVTINRLSQTFSGFATPTNFKETLIRSFQRSLCYPLLRSFEIAEQTLNDLKELLTVGKTAVVKKLIQLKRMFDQSEPRYILNEIFLDDMIVFLERLSQESDIYANELVQALQSITIDKNELAMGLIEIEQKAIQMAL